MKTLGEIPLFAALNESKNILIAGAGGGFDIYSGIPIYLSLVEKGFNVSLANFSFTFFSSFMAKKECNFCRRVSHENKEDFEGVYYPEKFLSVWLHEKGFPSDVYAFEKTGVINIRKAYEHLVKKLNIDTIILVDGGTDSLMFGDEPGLGTPIEDMTSIMAVSQLKSLKKYLVNTGFGVDAYHGVEHYYFLENVATLTKQKAFLGAFTLVNQMKEADLYNDLIEYVNEEIPTSPSIVTNSINSAVKGEYGDFHATFRTEGSELWINPLMSLYWCFELDAVAENIKCGSELIKTSTVDEVKKKILQYRKKATIKESKKLLG